jgi:16S rRNA (uracil1498-N3)-methyltransferase
VAVASAKQCGRAVVPEVEEPVAFADLVSEPAPGLKVLLVEPSAGVAVSALRDLPAPERATLAIGPEGGWTLDEVIRAVDAGWTPVRLGGRTLRAAAMPLAALAACQAIWQDD